MPAHATDTYGGDAWIKKLTRQGNSSALILDKAVMELLEIDNDTPPKLTVEGKRLIVEPLTPEERAAKFKELLKKDTIKHAELYRRPGK
ncbi:MAG TPA: hypothetical protein VK324_17875 [Tepidisphaeraceae bacterium]|nr:hypothetical protein [Tepidisphaeraceae bacterium]